MFKFLLTTHGLTCSSSENPVCFRYARSSKLGDQDIYYSWACGQDSMEVLALGTPTNKNSNPSSLPTLQSTQTQTGSNYIPNSGLGTPSGSGGSLSKVHIVLISVFAGGFVVVILAFICCCGYRRHRAAQDRLKFGQPPVNIPYQPTVTATGQSATGQSTTGLGSIYSWNLGVPHGPPPSNYSGTTYYNHPLSEMSRGSRR